MATETPHVLLGAGSGIIPSSSPEDLTSLLEHLKTLPIPIYGIDTAAIYPSDNPGKSEKVLGEAGIADAPFVLDTKILVGPTVDSSNGGSLSKVNLRNSVEKSLASLRVDKVRAIYAHTPDETTSAAEAVEGFGEVLKKGQAEIWGVSNFSPSQLAEYIAEAEKQGIPKPALYQGLYNPVARDSEAELFPLLRKHGIKFYAYSPSAGGFLTTKVASSKGADLPSRFQPGHFASERMNSRYNKPETLEALQVLYKVTQTHGIDVLDASLRWLAYHSPLGAGDGIILGASKMEQIEQNVDGIAKGSLPGELVAQFENLWEAVRTSASE